MKPLQLAITLAIAIVLIQFVKIGESFHLARCLPFCDKEITIYDFGAVAFILIFVCGIMRMNRSDAEEDE